MTDNGNKPHPVRTLTVKNFSVIKDAKLEFGKITVLIGPQASGKSLLCKLAYFLGKEVLELAVDRILGNSSLEEFRSLVIARFLNRFLTGQQWVMPYSSELVDGEYAIKIFGKSETPGGHDGDIGCLFSEEFDALYRSLLSEQPVEGRIGGKSRQDQQDEIWTRLNLSLIAPFVRESLYVPAGRAFFTDAQKGFSAVQNAGLDPIILRFAPEIVWNTRWRVGMVTAGDGVLERIRQMMVRVGKGEVIVNGDQALFRRPDGVALPLSLLSSGTQELLPLFNVLFRLASYQEEREVLRSAQRTSQYGKSPVGSKQLIYVEEPEANVFPSTQYELVCLFAWLSREPNLDFSWVITTHSPYILTAFNDLIKAGYVAAQRPDKVAEIEKIVPSKYWIKPGDFAAFAFDGKDGILRSIMDDETKMINGDTLDDISEKISEEFGQLLEIQYGD